jgi:hypothetical protein
MRGARSASCHCLARSGVTIFRSGSFINSFRAFRERRADEPHAKMM